MAPGAAGVHVTTGRKVESTQPADANAPRCRKSDQELVGMRDAHGYLMAGKNSRSHGTIMTEPHAWGEPCGSLFIRNDQVGQPHVLCVAEKRSRTGGAFCAPRFAMQPIVWIYGPHSLPDESDTWKRLPPPVLFSAIRQQIEQHILAHPCHPLKAKRTPLPRTSPSSCTDR